MALLEVKDLRVQFHTDDGIVKAVDGVDFTLDRGQTLGIVGESGSGKSVTCMSILGLARGGKVTGEAFFQGRDLLKLHPDAMRSIRGKQIAMIFQDEFGTAIIMITHDLGVVADMADQVLVMYAGKPVEVADRRTAYYHPHHPYTWGLLQSLPSIGADKDSERLRPIKGAPPSLIHPPSGCSFHPRCPYVMDVCTSEEPLLLDAAGDGHLSACHLSLEEKQRIWEEEVAPTR
jgi:oligopeptide/dipeptide ABC transporter ATP-binding protein